MTFEFALHWAESDITNLSATLPRPAAPESAAPPLSHPTMLEVAALVSELFAEGTLSWSQLNALGHLPELEGLLGDALASVPAARKAHRR